jgi:hypothetical protein
LPCLFYIILAIKWTLMTRLVMWLTTDQTPWAGIFLFTTTCRLTLEYWWLSRGFESSCSMQLTMYLHLVLRLRMHGALSPLLHTLLGMVLRHSDNFTFFIKCWYRWASTYELPRNEQFIFTNIVWTNKLWLPIDLINTEPHT